MSSLYIAPQDLSNDSCKRKQAPTTFSERLEYALKYRGMRQSDLAKEIGVSRSSVCQYLNNICEPKGKRFERVAKALDVNEPWLMGWDVPLTKYDGTPEEFPTAKDSRDEISYSQAIDILYKQMDFLSQESANTSDSIKLSCLSNSMSKVAEILLKYLEK